MTQPNTRDRKAAIAGLLFGSAALLLLSGCGPNRPKTIDVHGVVTLDGNPVEGAAVLFSPAEGRPATGTTDAQGKFELQTFEPGDGAVEGNHRVAVILKDVTGVGADPDGLSGEVAPGGMQVTWIVPEKYSDPITSGLTVDVNSSLELPVKLELTSTEN